MVAWALRSIPLLALVLLGGESLATAAESSNEMTDPGAGSVASYRIVATLDPTRHRVTGVGTIHWQNPSATSTSELYLHAYLNAFAHPRTRFLRSGSENRRSSTGLASPGSLSITRFVARELGSADLLPHLDTHSPDDPDDATDLRVQLPAPVAPASMLTLELEFTATLPTLVERSGSCGTFHAVTQWFPKLAYRDSAGTWHHFPYEPLAEFSSDFGDYDVTIDVPSDYVIAAPGIATTEKAGPNRRRERYRLEGVHDFAWFAWNDFVLTKAKVGSIEVRHYASRDQAENARSTLDILVWGLEHFGSRLTPYPYPSLTVVHPPDRASAAGGMEYPQLITTGGPWYLPHVGLHTTQAVALHELAHQWFYGVIASDEYSYPVLDEGLSSWMESEGLRSRYAAGSFGESTWYQLSEAALRQVQARRYSRRGPLALPAGAFGDFPSLSGRVYARFSTLFETLERVYGRQALDAALHAYAEQYQFRHPSPRDFLEAIRPHLPPRAVDAVSAALYTDGWVDFSVSRITSTPTPTRPGFSNRILIERRGSFDLPVLLEVEFKNGHVARKHLDSVAASKWIDWPYSSPIIAATLDPEHCITIDDDLENQTLRVDERPASNRLAAALHLVLSALWSLGWP